MLYNRSYRVNGVTAEFKNSTRSAVTNYFGIPSILIRKHKLPTVGLSPKSLLVDVSVVWDLETNCGSIRIGLAAPYAANWEEMVLVQGIFQTEIQKSNTSPSDKAELAKCDSLIDTMSRELFFYKENLINTMMESLGLQRV